MYTILCWEYFLVALRGWKSVLVELEAEERKDITKIDAASVFWFRFGTTSSEFLHKSD
jgi:hypothetical protein